MSTHSGAINALAASSTYDIYLPFTGRSADDPRTLRVSKLFALAWGIALTAGALMFKEQGTPVVVIALSIASFTQGGLLGGFFLGLFWSRAIQRDAILGMSVGISCMAFIVFAKQIVSAYPSMEPTLHGVASIAWPWYVLIGLSITFVTGAVSSFSHPAPAPPHVLQGNRS
jgi:Na+/proline symporter